MAHVQLAECGFGFRPMGNAINHCSAHTADTFPTVMIKSYRITAFTCEILIENIQHFQKGHVSGNVLQGIGFKVTRGFAVLLTPDFKAQVNTLCSHGRVSIICNFSGWV